MNVFIDESGSFVSAAKPDSWCVVVAVAAPEPARKQFEAALAQIRSGRTTREVKLHELTEEQYSRFVNALVASGAVLFAVATDSSLNQQPVVRAHQRSQVESIRANIPRMQYETGRYGLSALADQLESLPEQLYVQLVCQVRLLHTVTSRSISYFAQLQPSTLREIRWRIDQKNSVKPTFEKTFERLAPALLQTCSFGDPMLMVRGFDYSHMKQYEFAEGEYPTYLQEDYGLPPVDGFNLQKLIRRNLKFEDSKNNDGVQVADLLATGLRRCLRGRYPVESEVVRGLAQLTLQNERGRLPIELISFGDSAPVGEMASMVIRAMVARSRPYLLRRSILHD